MMDIKNIHMNQNALGFEQFPENIALALYNSHKTEAQI